MTRERLPANFGKPWTPEEDAQIEQEWREGKTLGTIAAAHFRTNSSVRLRLEKLGKIDPADAVIAKISAEKP